MTRRPFVTPVLLAAGLCASRVASAQTAVAGKLPQVDLATELLAQPAGLLVVIGAIALLPFAFMTLTAFVKISTVLQIVRGAIGTQNIPTNTVIMAFAGVLTLLAMAPVGSRIADRVKPVFESKETTATELVRNLVSATSEPLRGFLKANSSAREHRRFYELAKHGRSADEQAAVGRDDLIVVIPAFVVSELIEAFALGFAIYLPFLVLDLVVSNLLLALGMQMLNPSQISLPFKLLLFVAVDGWGLLAQALVTGYRPE